MIEDKKIVCFCGEEFIWTAGAQKFIEQLKQDGKIDEVHEPRRCFDCRVKRKKQIKDKEENQY